MGSIILYAGGKIKNSLFQKASDTYLQRFTYCSLRVLELSEKDFLRLIPQEKQFWIAFDERGQELSSEKWQTFFHAKIMLYKEIVLVVGPASGLSSSLRSLVNISFSLGRFTWPHLLARVLVLEQLYRFQQKMAGHPYSFI